MKKVDIVNSIAEQLGIPAPPMSTGSTEPKSILVAINAELGLGLDPKLDKRELARAIVEAAGLRWTPNCESRGGTITIDGLLATKEAVQFFLE